MGFDEILVTLELKAEDLTFWIQQGWIVPVREGETFHFSDVDLARAGLIRELHRELEIGAEAMPVVLSLLDQLYGVRRQVRTLMEALRALPEEQRAVVLARLGGGTRDA